MSIKHIVFALLIAISATLPAAAQVFRWVDEQGRVHFGDCPPADCPSEPIDIHPGPSERSVQAAQERAERLRAAERALRQEPAPETAESGPASPPAAHPEARPACFSPLAEAWGGHIADSREAVSRRALSRTEHQQLNALLDRFARRMRGHVDETTCIRPDATPPVRRERYRTDFHGFWRSGQVLQIEARLLGEQSGRVLRQFFRILSSREGLRFRATNTDSLFVLDQPANDVELIGLSAASLRFFRRQGGPQRRATVYEFRTAGRGVALEEYFYVQGVLVGKRLWTIDR